MRADRADGALVAGKVRLRVRLGQRSLAQHVERVAEAVPLALRGGAQRVLDGLADHELLAQHPHRAVHRGTDQRLAAAPQHAQQRAGQPALFADSAAPVQPPGDQQAPGGGVHEQRRALPEMRAPVAVADLVADQPVACGGIRHAQQRLRQAHQGHALLAGQGVFAHQPFHRTGAATRAQGLDQPGGQTGGRIGRDRCDPQQLGDAVRLGPPRVGGDAAACVGAGAPGRREAAHLGRCHA